jgi:hypothetical protein
MWPPAVEDVAKFFRTAGVDARLEELAAGESASPGPRVVAQALDCDRRLVVVLVPGDRAADPRRLGCVAAVRVPPPAFPYARARVYADRTIFSERTVWIEAGSPRHVAGLSPAQLVRLTNAQTGDFVAEA